MSPLYSKHRNFILYGFIGGICTLIDISIYYLLGHANLHYLISNIISYNCGVISSFFMNRQFNFKVKDKAVSRFCSFYLISLIGMVICEGLLWILVDGLEMNSLVAKILATIMVGVAQFLLVKRITFKKSAANKS